MASFDCLFVLLWAGFEFIVLMHNGGTWTNTNGKKKYEGGNVTEFKNCHTDMFNVFELEGMLLEVQWCHTDVHFWFKPKDRELDDGFELKGDRDLLAMFEDMRKNNYCKAEVYADASGKFGADAPELDAFAEKDQGMAIVCSEIREVDYTPPPGPKLKRCIIEELPDDADVPVDARVSAREDDYVMSNAELRELEEELEWAENLESANGENEVEDDGEEEFFMYMPGVTMSDNEEYQSPPDSDSSVQILEDWEATGNSSGWPHEAQCSRHNEAQSSPPWSTPIPP